jgi:ABC-type multidrug transport system fused ATPase/permease subunit
MRKVMNTSFWRLMAYLRGYRWLVALSIVSNVFTALFTALSIPLLIPFLEILFDRAELIAQPQSWAWNVESIARFFQRQLSLLIIERGKSVALLYVCGAILLVFFCKNLFRYLSMFFMAPVRNGIIRDLRRQVFDKMLALPLAYFSGERKGDMMSRITADVQEVEWSILNVLEAVFREPLIIAGALGFMLYVSPSLTVFVFGLMLFTGIVIGGIGRALKRSSAVVQEKLGRLAAAVEETLSGLRIVKGFNAEEYQRHKFGQENEAYRRILTRLIWRRDLSSPLSEFFGIATVAALLWYGARLVFSGEMDAATFLTFIFAFYNIIEPAKSFSRSYYSIQKGVAAMRRVEQVLHAGERIVEAPTPRPLHEFRSAIEYRGVVFAYREKDTPVLRNIDLLIPKGKTVALVGASGAGKSTLVDLLPRFYDVTEGGIFIDGVDIREYALRDLRALIGIVSQDPILFNDTIYNNIVFGAAGVAPSDVVRAARVANAHEFILQTEQGYQTNIGDRGGKLSGGQRQRLTIARAVLRDPPILILDEATSALDSESESLVREALLKIMQGRTALVIAHRLSTVQHADEIIVLKEGRIIQRGRHDELVARKGEYQKLVALQGL